MYVYSEDIYCKTSYEFDTYYKAVEEHPDKENKYYLFKSSVSCFECVFHSYQWFCHLDDDMYVNILQLSQLLQQYDSHKPYYVGKWPISRRGKDDVNVSENVIK